MRVSKERIYSVISLTLIYSAGVLAWFEFFNYGLIPQGIWDWPKEYGYYNVIQHAFAQSAIPYHMSFEVHGTHRFLANPEIIISPQTYLLKWTNIGSFVCLHIALLYTIGFRGLVALRNKYKLTMPVFIFLFLLFNFNGYITSRLGVGHLMWGGYFFLSWFAFFVCKLTELSQSKKDTSLKLALILFLMLMQGSLHLVVICLLFLTLFTLTNTRIINEYLQIIFWTCLLSAGRLIPAAMSFVDHKLEILQGFPTPIAFIRSFVENPYVGQTYLEGTNMFIWEFDMFIGALSFLTIVFFGILYRLRISKSETDLRLWQLDWACLGLLIVSCGPIWQMLNSVNIPFISVERIPSRFIIIPFLFVLVSSCIYLQRYFRNQGKKLPIRIFSIALVFIAIELAGHTIIYSSDVLGQIHAPWAKFDFFPLYDPSDQNYVRITQISYLVSFISFGVWLQQIFSKKKTKPIQ